MLAIAVVVSLWATKQDFGLGRNMEIMVNLMRELSLQYVDEVAPDKLMKDGAAGMVRNLDPYTTYMSESEMNDFVPAFLTPFPSALPALLQDCCQQSL